MSTIVVSSQIERLKEIQARNGLSNMKFAERIGISYEYLRQIKKGKKLVGMKAIKGIKDAFPDEDIQIFLSYDVVINAEKVTTDTTPSENSPDRFLARFRVWLMSKFLGVKFPKDNKADKALK